MEVTFLIGNGFDLNLGLCTKYTDFYPHYIDDSRFDSDDPAVRSFKQLLRRGGDYDRWADFEAALGEHTTEPPLNEADSLRRCLQHFKRCFAQYLREEDRHINFEACGAEIARRFVSDLYSHLIYLEPQACRRIQTCLPAEKLTHYNILDFNYTTVIDRLISDYYDPDDHRDEHLRELIHVHGTYDSGMLIGLDNIGQVANPDLFADSRRQRLLLKPLLNQQSGLGSDLAARECIDRSDEICIFGMSLGKTDAVWWERIGQWLQRQSYRQLLIFSRKTGLDPLFWDDILDCQESVQDLFFFRAGLDTDLWDRLREQIYVPLNAGIFHLEPVFGRYPHSFRLDPTPHLEPMLLSQQKGAPL